MIIVAKHNNGLFPSLGHSDIPTPTARFTLNIRGSHVSHLDIVQFLNRTANLDFVGLFVDFKTVCILGVREMHTLLCNQRLNDDAVIVHDIVLYF